MSSTHSNTHFHRGLLLAATLSVSAFFADTAHAESTPAQCSMVQVQPSSGTLPINIGGISLIQDFAGLSAFPRDAGQLLEVEASIRAVGSADTVPLAVELVMPSEGRVDIRFAEPIAPGSRVELTYPDCWGPSEHTIDFVEPVEFPSPLAEPEVERPVGYLDDSGVSQRNVVPVRQPLPDLLGSQGLFWMRVMKDGAALGPAPLDAMEIPVSCANGDEIGEMSIKVEILSPVGDVVAEGLETLVTYDCAERTWHYLEEGAFPHGEGGNFCGTDSGPWAADAGVGGADTRASSGCSVGVIGGDSAGLGFWALLGAVMLGRRRRSNA